MPEAPGREDTTLCELGADEMQRRRVTGAVAGRHAAARRV